MNKCYCGQINDWDDAKIEMARLHALTDLANDYICENTDAPEEKINNIAFIIQAIHDLAVVLEGGVCVLAQECSCSGTDTSAQV